MKVSRSAVYVHLDLIRSSHINCSHLRIICLYLLTIALLYHPTLSSGNTSVNILWKTKLIHYRILEFGV